MILQKKTANSVQVLNMLKDVQREMNKMIAVLKYCFLCKKLGQ